MAGAMLESGQERRGGFFRQVPIGTELGQARFRVLNVSPFCLYLLFAKFFQWHAVSNVLAVGALGYIAYAVCWVFIVHFDVMHVTVRRTLATMLDQLLPALGLYLAGFLAGWVAWVPALGAVGNGLRFGTRYSKLSAIVCAPAMAMAFFFSADWSSIPAVSTGIVLANVLVPLYMVMLVQRIEQDKRSFELRAAHFEAETKRDALTGLFNRAGFAKLFAEMTRQGDAKPENVALLLLDLDGFKAVNDAFGHAGGDAILVSTAAVLLKSVRPSDGVARLGGDEFGILLRHVSDPHTAEVLALRILDAIKELRTERDDLRLGASIGICMLPHVDLPTYDDVIKTADRLMYLAKAAGKNQFRTHAVTSA